MSLVPDSIYTSATGRLVGRGVTAKQAAAAVEPHILRGSAMSLVHNTLCADFLH
jgi:hypothetical protein